MSTDAEYHYRTDVVEQLWRHGVHPTTRTPPALVHEFVSDLYRYELRRLRDRLLKKEFPKPEYYGRVVDLRKRYWLVSMKPDEWLVRYQSGRDASNGEI